MCIKIFYISHNFPLYSISLKMNIVLVRTKEIDKNKENIKDKAK